MERTKNILVQGSIPEFEHDGDDLDRIYLPVRGIQTAVGMEASNPGNLVVLPESKEVQGFLEGTKKILSELQLPNPESVLIPDTSYFLDIALNQHIELLMDKISINDRHIVWPYANTEVSDDWFGQLKRRGYSVTNSTPRKEYKAHQTRALWGRRMSDPDKPSFPEKYGIPYPKSYIAAGYSELGEAYERMVSETRQSVVWLKLAASAGGFGVEKVGSVDEVERYYQLAKTSGALFLFGDPSKEIDIEVQENISPKYFGSYQYNSGQVLTPGGISLQILDDQRWSGNKFNVLQNGFISKVNDIHTRITRGMKNEGFNDFYGWGGVDLAVVKDTDIMVVENNWGRITGAHPGIYFANALGVTEKPFLVKKLPPPKVDAKECFNMLKKEGLSFDPSRKSGAVPIPWVENIDAFIFVAGENDKQISEITNRVINLTQKNGYH